LVRCFMLCTAVALAGQTPAVDEQLVRE
jgi:hypothetical protein